MPASAEAPQPIAGRVAITSVAQIGTMAAGGLLAILIGRRFGTNAQTDGLFLAYSVYGVLLMVAQSLRLTMVPRLARADGAARSFADGLGALAVIAGFSAILLVGLADPLATLLGGSGDGHDVTRDALRLFWLAASAQLCAGYAAARLAAEHRFAETAAAYLSGSFLPVLALAVWPDPGIRLVPTLITGGALVTAALIGVAVWRQHVPAGARPTPRGSLTTASQMVAGALGSIMWQIALVASLAFAQRIAEGAVTVYTYAFFASGLVVAATSGSLAMVIAAPLTSGWDRGDPKPLEPALVMVVKTSTTLAVPLLGIALLAGDEIIDVVLGSVLSGGEITTMRNAFLALGGVTLAAAVSPVPALAAYARSQYWPLAGIALVGLVAHVALSAGAATLDDPVALAGAASIAAWLIALLTIWFVWREDVVSLSARVLAEIGSALALGAVAFIPLQLASGRAPLAIVGLAAYAVLVRMLLPGHWTPISDALRSLARR